jgi:Asp-tRNA(Asn)/Glu-tRNA(Gln) amidotransferase A subunit family amidase
MSSHKRRLERLEDLIGPPARPDATAAHEKIRRALDRVAALRRRQGVAVEDLSLETDEDREAWAIFDAVRKQATRGEGARADA